MWEKLQLNKNHLLIAYKILNDVLFVGLVFFFLALVAEGLLPGIITAHVGFPKIIIFILVDLMAISALASAAQIKIESRKQNKKAAFALLFVLLLLIFNSLIKLNIFLSVFILIILLATGYFFYKAVFEE